MIDFISGNYQNIDQYIRVYTYHLNKIDILKWNTKSLYTRMCMKSPTNKL